MLSSLSAYTADEKYEICFVNGYFAGEDDKFMIGLASYIAGKENLLTDPVCTAAHKAAYDVGVKFSTTGKYDSDQELQIIMYASKFREKVNKAISQLIDK